jgi:hypothetical protein
MLLIVEVLFLDVEQLSVFILDIQLHRKYIILCRNPTYKSKETITLFIKHTCPTYKSKETITTFVQRTNPNKVSNIIEIISYF